MHVHFHLKLNKRHASHYFDSEERSWHGRVLNTASQQQKNWGIPSSQSGLDLYEQISVLTIQETIYLCYLFLSTIKIPTGLTFIYFVQELLY